MSLNDMSVMRSGRKNTRLKMQDLAQMEKQEEGEGLEEVRELLQA